MKFGRKSLSSSIILIKFLVLGGVKSIDPIYKNKDKVIIYFISPPPGLPRRGVVFTHA
jgi:hypothetical protein